MSETKFTPGPWMVIEPEATCANGWGGFALVAPSPIEFNDKSPCFTTANAHLIAAAPDLYEALECALGLLEDEDWGHTKVWNVGNAVLAKARGE